MAELSNVIKEIKIGKSFMKGDSTCFHTFRYDFMPASVDTSKRATIDIGEGNQVTVTVPHIEGSGTANTVFKGSKKPYQKECVLVFDRSTGEITLEKLTSNVQLKKTRAEGSSKIRSGQAVECSSKKSPKQQKPHSATFGRSSPVQKCSPLPKSPLSHHPSPGSSVNPPSMPLLGAEEQPPSTSAAAEPVAGEPVLGEPEIGVLSSSSDSSSSEDSSDSSDNEAPASPKFEKAAPQNGSSQWGEPSSSTSVPCSMPKFSMLSEDLKLSESDSESDG